MSCWWPALRLQCWCPVLNQGIPTQLNSAAHSEILIVFIWRIIKPLTHWPLEGCCCNAELRIFKFRSSIQILSISCETVLRVMPQDLTEVYLALVQVMAWCHQTSSHYLSQNWPKSVSLYGVTRPQWVKPWWWWHKHFSQGQCSFQMKVTLTLVKLLMLASCCIFHWGHG